MPFSLGQITDASDNFVRPRETEQSLLVLLGLWNVRQSLLMIKLFRRTRAALTPVTGAGAPEASARCSQMPL